MAVSFLDTKDPYKNILLKHIITLAFFYSTIYIQS